MTSFKSHFVYSKKQRKGIFLFLILIFALQFLYWIVIPKLNAAPEHAINDIELEHFYKEMDSLKALAIEEKKPKIYPFNPNYISDYKGYTLGMTTIEVDRLLAYRAQNKWVNSAKEFQNITKVSDSLLAEITPFFKFPEWITNPKAKTNFKSNYNTPKTEAQKVDLNIATAGQLQKV